MKRIIVIFLLLAAAGVFCVTGTEKALSMPTENAASSERIVPYLNNDEACVFEKPQSSFRDMHILDDDVQIPEHEADQIRAFFAQKDEKGISNGQKAAERLYYTYDPYDYNTWQGTIGYERVTGHVMSICNEGLDFVGELCIQDFPYLEMIELEGCSIEKYSFTDCPNLHDVQIAYNKCKPQITFENTPNVWVLWLMGTPVEDLDITGMPNLEALSLANGCLAWLDLSHNHKLWNVNANGMIYLYDMDLGGKPLAQTVSVNDTRLSDIRLENTGGVSFFGAERYKGERFTIRNCPELVALGITESNIRYLDFDSIENVSKLYLDKDKYLENVDLSHVRRLGILKAASTSLTDIDLSAAEEIHDIDIHHSNVERLKLPDTAEFLYELNCYENNISELDLHTALYLYSLDCRYNNIKRLDVSSVQPYYTKCTATSNPVKAITNMPYLKGANTSEYAKFSAFALGAGTIEYNGKTLVAKTDENAEFFGWYDRESNLISSDTKIDIFSTDLAKLGYYEARFTGYEADTAVIPDEYKQADYPYNEYETGKLRDFFAIVNPLGVSNAERIHAELPIFDADNPITWPVKYTDDGHVCEIVFSNGPDGGWSLWGDLDLSGFTELKYLRLQNSYLQNWQSPNGERRNGLLSLNLSGCGKLEYLRLAHQQRLVSLDLSGCVSLQNLNVADCTYLESLDISDCRQLKYLNAEKCLVLAALDTSRCPDLTYVYAGDTSITTFDFTNNTVLELADIHNTPLESLALPNSDKFNTLYADRCGIEEIAYSGCSGLETLMLSDNPLKTLDVSKLSRLTKLYVDRCGLDTIDVSKNTELKALNAARNNLTSLDLNANTKLTVLIADKNKLTEVYLPVSDTSTMLHVALGDNPLTELSSKRIKGRGEGEFIAKADGDGSIYQSAMYLYAVGDNFKGWYDENGSLISRNARMEIPAEGKTFTARFSVYDMGDCNLDGKVNTGDAVVVLKYSAEKMQLTDEQKKLADTNHDGSVNTGDAVIILKYVSGVIAFL